MGTRAAVAPALTAAATLASFVSQPQVLYGVNQRLRVEDVDSPLCEIRPVKSVLLVVLSGDRGLCGGYNNFIIKKVRFVIGALRHQSAQAPMTGRGDRRSPHARGSWKAEPAAGRKPAAAWSEGLSCQRLVMGGWRCIKQRGALGAAELRLSRVQLHAAWVGVQPQARWAGVQRRPPRLLAGASAAPHPGPVSRQW